MVGTGPQEFGFSNDYAGCGQDWSRHCFSCAPVGHSVVVSRATSFMVNPPDNLGASYNRADQVSIPASSTSNPPEESSLLLATLDRLASMLHAEASTIGEVLDFVAPNLLDQLEANWLPLDQGPFDQQPGGGIDVKLGTYDQKVVTGIHHWDFDGVGRFQWEFQSSATMDGSFNACDGCGTTGNHYAVMVKNYRNAKLTLLAPQ
jgi:hypothetical protein